MLNTRKLKVTDLNPHLICVLCGGYYVDATTIIECLHSFCRSCIVRYLESNKYCPICDVQVHKTRPLQNIRPDTTLQTIVYKLVPGLFQNEMRCRREFYTKYPEAKLQVQNPEARGELTDQSPIFLPDDQISICLEYMGSSESQQGSYGRRYLRCPAAVTVLHLHKFIRAKFGLTSHKVDVMYKEDILLENWTLMDVAYIYQWRRKCPIHLSYRILEIRRKRVKLPIESAQTSLSASSNAKAPRKENDTSVCTKDDSTSSNPENCDPDKCSAPPEWKGAVQLRISENGVMSVTGIENTNRLLAPPQLFNVDDFESSVVKNSIAENKVNCKNTNEIEANETNKTGVKDPTIPTSTSSSLTTSTSTLSKSSSASSSTSTSSCGNLQVVGSAELGDNRTKVSEANNSTVLSNTTTIACSGESLARIESSNIEQIKPKDNNNISSVKSANKAHQVESNETKELDNSQKTDITSTVESNLQKENSQTKTETANKIDSKSNSKRNAARPIVTSKEQVTSKPKDQSSNLVDIFACDPPRPPNSHKVYPGVKSTSTSITAPLAKDDPSKQSVQKSNAIKHPKPTPMEILNAAVPKKLPNSTSKYKTLKSPTKSWNPTIPRSAMLSMKQSQAVNQSKDSNSSGTDGANPPPAKQPKFFKLRNMPRFLGNPASGVKPMYQVAPSSEIVSQSASTSATTSIHKPAKTTNSSITLMKIDPKTLCPISVNPVSHVLSSPPKSTSSPPPKKQPPPYTPGSPKTPNHYNSSRSAHSNASGVKPPVPRIPSPAHTGGLIPSNPFIPSVAHNNPHLLYNTFPFPPTDSSGSRLLPGAPNTELIRAMSALCSSGTAYHPSLPPSISMLFNPHHPHHRLTQADRATFKSLTEDKQALPSPPAVQRIPPSNPISSKPSTDSAPSATSNSTPLVSPILNPSSRTKKERNESCDSNHTNSAQSSQPQKAVGSGVESQPPNPSPTENQSKGDVVLAESKTNTETNHSPKTNTQVDKVNHIENNKLNKEIVSNEPDTSKSSSSKINSVNSVSCKAKLEKSATNEKHIDSSDSKEKSGTAKNNNYSSKGSTFTDGSNIMISENSLKV